MNLETINKTLYGCFLELTSDLSETQKQDMFSKHLKITTLKSYETFRYPLMNVKIFKK